MRAAIKCVSQEILEWLGNKPQSNVPYRKKTSMEALTARVSRRMIPDMRM
jgi:hypothetical protein